MRARSLTFFTAVVAVLVMAIVAVAGCEAKIAASRFGAPERKPSHPYGQPQPRLVELMLRAITPPAAPGAVLDSELIGLRTRIRQATDGATANGATLSVALFDRDTHQLLSNGNTHIIATASVAKLFIADDLLLQESEGKTTLSDDDRQALDVMLRSSDDGAAQRFWEQDGGNAIITEVAKRYGLTSTTPPSDGHWWNTITSSPDLIRYYEMLLDGSGGLPREKAGIIVNDLAQSTPNGVDGYPQRFGIPDGLYAEQVAVKQGWMCCIGGSWLHLSTGLIGSDRRYIMVIESLQKSDDATARATITQAVKTMFPKGQI